MILLKWHILEASYHLTLKSGTVLCDNIIVYIVCSVYVREVPSLQPRQGIAYCALYIIDFSFSRRWLCTVLNNHSAVSIVSSSPVTIHRNHPTPPTGIYITYGSSLSILENIRWIRRACIYNTIYIYIILYPFTYELIIIIISEGRHFYARG